MNGNSQVGRSERGKERSLSVMTAGWLRSACPACVWFLCFFLRGRRDLQLQSKAPARKEHPHCLPAWQLPVCSQQAPLPCLVTSAAAWGRSIWPIARWRGNSAWLPPSAHSSRALKPYQMTNLRAQRLSREKPPELHAKYTTYVPSQPRMPGEWAVIHANTNPSR
jgi:hypothetical protein